MLSITRRAAADRPRNLRHPITPPALALSQLWRPHGGHRETYGCPNPTPFSAMPGYRCHVKSFDTTRKLCVFHHAPPPCALPPIRSLRLAPSHLSLATVLPFCQLPDMCCYLLRLPTHLRRTSTNPLHSIQFP